MYKDKEGEVVRKTVIESIVNGIREINGARDESKVRQSPVTMKDSR